MKKSTAQILFKQEKTLQNTGRTIHPMLLPILLIFLTIMDGLTINQLIDAMFYQDWILSLAVTIGLAILLEGIPCVGAHFYQKRERSFADHVILAALTVVFTILVLILFVLRWNTRDIMFEQEVLFDGSITQAPEIFEATPAQNTMAVLMGFSPLATSVVAFCLACAYDSKQQYQERLHLVQIRYRELLTQKEAEESELIEELKRDLMSQEREAYRNARETLGSCEMLLKNRARQLLAIHLSTADAVSKLLEEPRSKV